MAKTMTCSVCGEQRSAEWVHAPTQYDEHGDRHDPKVCGGMWAWCKSCLDDGGTLEPDGTYTPCYACYR